MFKVRVLFGRIVDVCAGKDADDEWICVMMFGFVCVILEGVLTPSWCVLILELIQGPSWGFLILGVV